MPEVRIPMDPMNPGQFFACCGLWELFDLRGARALAHFEVNDRRPRQAEFVLESDGELSLAATVGGLREAKVEASQYEEKSIAPIDKSIVPIRIGYAGNWLELDWWLDRFREKADWLKCWAGQQTSLSITSELVRLLPANADEALLNYRAMTTTRFGVDPRSAWNAADVGYSPNEHQQESATFPAVEMLAAVGLGGFRPERRRREREYVYALWPVPLPRAVGRLACCAPWDGLGARGFRFRLGKRGNYKVFRFSQAEERSDSRS